MANIPETAACFTLEAFDAFNADFRVITHRAQERYRQRDWAGGSSDAVARLDLYEQVLDQVAGRLEAELGPQVRDQPIWIAAKKKYASLVEARYDIDRAETFFNSVTRRMLNTVGIDREVEFFHLRPVVREVAEVRSLCRTYGGGSGTAALIRRVFDDVLLGVAFENPERDAALVAEEVDLYLWPIVGTNRGYSIDVVESVFYRNKEAYIVGRILVDGRAFPMIIPLSHGDSGIHAETVLLHESEATILFSFAYSYFFVDVERHDVLIRFLKSIMPRAGLSELYTVLGYNRHGKTEFYRDLHRFVHVSREQFVIAPGLEGAVMIAFTLPNFEFVFKVIKDRPCFLRSAYDTPKTTTAEKVKERYAFISHRDPAGRMVDTQEFENLRFRKRRFSVPLLAEFTQAARENVFVGEEYVVISHLYVQRKVVPLPMYFESERDPEAIRRVLVDFGWFLKDIAASGVFPCDLFNTWNYGVTQWGRVVLYDYDDVLPIEKVRFREKPAARNEVEEYEPEEEWIFATDEDFFIDELDRYSGIPGPLKGIFRAVHADLYTLKFWHTLTDRVVRGEIFGVIPYDRSKQFRVRDPIPPP
jgi:isocitrate dehydrogenase kinase/phosphatase